jgi:hypothetical protein
MLERILIAPRLDSFTSQCQSGPIRQQEIGKAPEGTPVPSPSEQPPKQAPSSNRSLPDTSRFDVFALPWCYLMENL